jgi:hypothetical protein
MICQRCKTCDRPQSRKHLFHPIRHVGYELLHYKAPYSRREKEDEWPSHTVLCECQTQYGYARWNPWTPCLSDHKEACKNVVHFEISNTAKT